MKKNILLMAAASAIMFTACTSEDDILQTGQQKATAAKEVGFEVYTPAATNVTRAGLTGTMTTNRLQLAEQDGGGFGVYAFLTEDIDGTAFNPADGSGATYYTPTAGQDPNFMANEKILWNETNLGWYYNPLKYWPNETENDSQGTPASMESDHQSGSPLAYDKKHLDRLTFFAYAPYVSAGAGSTGITAITDNNGQLSSTDVTDPTIKYVSTDKVGIAPADHDAVDVEPDDYVDLLWGVAPAGGLSYTAVNGTTVTVDEGKPLINMIKPDVNTSMKFLFNHALARFGINVVAAVDQVSPGGELDSNTKITINNVTISGPFGITGELNLNNGDNANIANWTKIQDDPIGTAEKAITTTQSITVTAKGTKKAIAEHLRWAGEHTFGSYSAQDVVGVTTAKQDLLRPSSKWFNKLASAPVYSPGKKYYSSLSPLTAATAKVAEGTKFQKDGKWGFFYTKDASDVYVKQAADVTAPVYPEHIYGSASTLYFVTATAHVLDGSDASALGKLYSIDNASNDGTAEDKTPKFTYYDTSAFNATAWTAENGKTYYTLEAVNLSNAETPYKYDPAGTYYEAERNYLYVVPTNNVAKNCDLTDDGDKVKEKALRTITVQIEYYITTKDEKVGNGYTQTKNVITKEVVLPSLANGKSYMLNMVLGLTSVKIEAEVDDWKVVNSQVDLPQNTAD